MSKSKQELEDKIKTINDALDNEIQNAYNINRIPYFKPNTIELCIPYTNGIEVKPIRYTISEQGVFYVIKDIGGIFFNNDRTIVTRYMEFKNGTTVRNLHGDKYRYNRGTVKLAVANWDSILEWINVHDFRDCEKSVVNYLLSIKEDPVLAYTKENLVKPDMPKNENLLVPTSEEITDDEKSCLRSKFLQSTALRVKYKELIDAMFDLKEAGENVSFNITIHN